MGGAGAFYVTLERISPRLMDFLVMATCFKGQETREAKPADAPNNLFEHLGGFHKPEGDFRDRRSITTWVETHPGASAIVAGAMIAAASAAFAFLSSNPKRK